MRYHFSMETNTKKVAKEFIEIQKESIKYLEKENHELLCNQTKKRNTQKNKHEAYKIDYMF